MRSKRSVFVLGLIVVAGFLLWPTRSEAAGSQRAVRDPRPVSFAGAFYYGYPPFIWHPWYPGWYWPYPYDYYRLARYEETGSVRLQVSPRQSRVYVDGYFVGVVDDFDGAFQRLRLPPGGYEIAVHHEGFRTLRQSVYVQPRGTMTVRGDLVPLQPGERGDPLPIPSPQADPGRQGGPGSDRPAGRAAVLGTISLRIDPPDAEVRVDRGRWQRANGEEGLTIEVPEGTHRVEVRRAGYGRFVAEVDVRRGEDTSLDVRLPPAGHQR